jgi:hypothetical protein
MTKNVQLGILLAIVGFMMGMGTGYWYWSMNCATVTATATLQLENVMRDLNQRMDSSRGPIFPIPLAKADRKEMRDVIQKFTTDLNGNLYMLVPIPTSAQIREVKPAAETTVRKPSNAAKPPPKEELPQAPPDQKK